MASELVAEHRRSWEAVRRANAEVRAELYEPGYRESGATPIFGLVGFREWSEPIYALLVGAGADPKATDDNGWTMLHHAVKAGDPATVRILLGKGLDPDAPTNGGLLPLDLAARVGYGFSSAAVARVLLAGGADPKRPNGAGLDALASLRAEASRILTRALYDPGDRYAADIPTYLREANATARALDSGAAPIAVPPPATDARGRRFAPLVIGSADDLIPGEERFDVSLSAERAVRVENGRAILDLRFAPPKTATTLVLTRLELENYETLTPLPLTLEFTPGEAKTLLLAFPVAAAPSTGPGGAVGLDYETRSGLASGRGTQNEGTVLGLTFGSGAGREPITVGHNLPGRTVLFVVESVVRNGKPVPFAKGRELRIEPGRRVPIPGLRGPLGGVGVVRYRYRALPNPTWREETIGL